MQYRDAESGVHRTMLARLAELYQDQRRNLAADAAGDDRRPMCAIHPQKQDLSKGIENMSWFARCSDMMNRQRFDNEVASMVAILPPLFIKQGGFARPIVWSDVEPADQLSGRIQQGSESLAEQLDKPGRIDGDDNVKA